MRRPACDAPIERAWLWQKGRLVCSDWRQLIEKAAKDVWLTEARLSADGPMIYTENDGKVFLGAELEFKRCEGDLAVFQQKELGRKRLRATVRNWIKSVCRYDCFLGAAVHDLRLPGLRLTDDPLYTITVEWKRYVGHILAEEAILEPMRKAALAEMTQWARHEKYRNRANPTGMDIYAAFKVSDKYRNLADNRRRRERMGRKNPKGDERLSRAREWEMEYLDGKGEGGSQYGVGASDDEDL